MYQHKQNIISKTERESHPMPSTVHVHTFVKMTTQFVSFKGHKLKKKVSQLLDHVNCENYLNTPTSHLSANLHHQHQSQLMSSTDIISRTPKIFSSSLEFKTKLA